MPFIRPQTNNYFGFVPAGEILSARPYLVSSSEGAIYSGDPCVQTSINTVRALTSAGGVTNFTSSMAYVGVAAGQMAANAGSTAAAYGGSQMVTLYDHPSQKFVVCDTTSGVIGSQVGLFKNYALLTTGAIGSTGPSPAGQSNVCISGVASTAAGAFHVTELHPIEKNIHSTVGAATAGSAVNVRKWIGFFVTGVNQHPISYSAVTTMNMSLQGIANTTS